MHSITQRLVWLLALTLTVSAATGVGAVPAAENPVPNSGFEELDESGFPVGWRGSRQVYSSATESHSGERSLHYTNDDPQQYEMCGQSIKLKPGRRYRISAWIKTEDIAGRGGGATLCLEWYKNGKYYGGTYPGGLTRTNEWTHWEAVTERTPREFDSTTITCYVRPGMTGRAWWDDVKVNELPGPLMQFTVLEPNYRGWMYGDWPPVIRMAFDLSLADYGLKTEQVLVRVRLLGSDGEQVLFERDFEVRHDEFKASFPRPPLEPGQYSIEARLVNRATNEALTTAAEPLRQWERTIPEARCWIDRHQRLIVDGVPFFPLVMYAGLPKPGKLGRVAKAGFNCLMPYDVGKNPPEVARDYLDVAEQAGIKTIFSTKDLYEECQYFPRNGLGPWQGEEEILRGIVTEFRHHPNVLAWYICDELGIHMVDRMREHRRMMHELDIDHPTWAVICYLNDVRQYLPSFDVIGTDTYPVPGAVSRVGEWARVTHEEVYGARPVWMVPQMHNLEAHSHRDLRPPTLAEMRNMAYQCVCEGATGLVFFSLFSLGGTRMPRSRSAGPMSSAWGANSAS